MKMIKDLSLLLICAFLLGMCSACSGKQALQTANIDQIEWRTYTSSKYHFSVSFPSLWQVIELPNEEYPLVVDQIWFVSENRPMQQTDSIADITLIFTHEDSSSNWESQYFDDYRSEVLWLGDIQARKISGINKESKSSELVVLAEIGDYYLEALPNRNDLSQEYFDQVISSITYIQEGEKASSQIPPGILGGLDEKTTTVFEGISFSYPSSLAEKVSPQRIPAYRDPSDIMYKEISEHVRFDFSETYLEQAPFSALHSYQFPWLMFQNKENIDIHPIVFIFPASSYAAINPVVRERIKSLEILLDGRELPRKGILPLLPTFNSTQDFSGQIKGLKFHGGRGVRFITRYSQEVSPMVNPSVFYTFQGLTDDGRIYVAAFFPLYIHLFPNASQIEDWDAFNNDYQQYLQNIASNLETLKPEEFSPNLNLLDALISSLTISDEAISTYQKSLSVEIIPQQSCYVTASTLVTFLPDGHKDIRFHFYEVSAWKFQEL